MAHIVCADCSLCGLRAMVRPLRQAQGGQAHHPKISRGIDVVLLSHPSPFCLCPQWFDLAHQSPKAILIILFCWRLSRKFGENSFLRVGLQCGKIA
jgi:hypothetical protein